MIHNFTTDYDYAESLHDQYFYALIDAGFVCVVRTDKAEDLQGADYRCLDENENWHYVDVKASRYRYGNVALELASSSKNQGWLASEGKITDYVFFYWQPDRFGLLVRYTDLRNAFLAHRAEWCQTYPVYKQDNGQYRSACIVVPVEVVLDAIDAALPVAA